MMNGMNQNEYNFLSPVAPRACRGDGTGACGVTDKPQLNTFLLRKNKILKRIYLTGQRFSKLTIAR